MQTEFEINYRTLASYGLDEDGADDLIRSRSARRQDSPAGIKACEMQCFLSEKQNKFRQIHVAPRAFVQELEREQERNQQAMLRRRDRRMTAGRTSAHGMRPDFNPRRNWIRRAAASDRLLKNQFLP
jgi:hypothetical protein